MSFRKEITTGKFAAGAREITYYPSDTSRAGKPGIIYLHGAGGPDMGTRGTWPWNNIMLSAFAAAGFPVVAGWMGSTLTTDPWANDASQTVMTNALAWLSAQTGASATKAHLIGLSHGGCMMTRWAEDNPTLVSSLTGIIPFLDIADEYNTNTLGFQAAIATAWGLTVGTDAMPARGNIMTRASAIQAANIPVNLFWSSHDTVITNEAAKIAAFVTASGANAVDIDATSTGHSDGTVKQLANWNGGSSFSALISLLASIA